MVRVLTGAVLVVDHVAVGFPDYPRAGKKQYTRQPIERHVGGHTANAAIDLVKLGLDPAAVGVVGAIGRDDEGQFIRETFNRFGIQCFLAEYEEVPTGKNLILVPEGQDRTFILSPGANLSLAAEHVANILLDAQPEILSLRPGYTGIDGNLARVFRSAQDIGAYTLLDVIEPFAHPWSVFRSALPYLDAVHANDDEAMAVTGAASVEEAIEALLGFGVKLVLLTLGARGAIVATEQYRVEQPAFQVNVADPSGCGDAFCAGVIAKLLDRSPEQRRNLMIDDLADIVTLAQAVGAAAATAVGCTAGVSFRAVDALFDEQAERVVSETRLRLRKGR